MTVLIKDNLTIEDFINVVRYKAKVELSTEAIFKIKKANDKIKNIIKSNDIIYGVNTGFGRLCDTKISQLELKQLQVNLLKSHACGVGKHFNSEVVRGMMLLRINALAKGYSGLRVEVIEQLITYLNHDIIPAIPEKGSLGASGDLAPLSHMALTLIGEGEVYYQGKFMPTKEAVKLCGIKPLAYLEAKEGLSLINGTQAMTSIGAITVYDAKKLVKQADIIGALSLEALLGIKDAFDEKLHVVRGHLGQIESASNIRKLTEKSTFLTDQKELKVQDAYSLRCMPQVHGASRDALDYVLEKIEIEMNAVTDNPLIFEENRVISGGNFHGQPVALSFDFMKIALAELANISERRIERLVNPALSSGLPPFLVVHPGLNSGFMIVQYSAAALVSENKVLAHPASVDSIPSSANQEDHVSMGTIASRGASEILTNTMHVLAMELFCACQAIDLRKGYKLGEGSKIVYDYVRRHLPFIEEDTIMYPYLEMVFNLVQSNAIIPLVEKAIGRLF